MIRIEEMVGRSVDSVEVKNFLNSVDAKSVFVEEEGKLYWESHGAGVEVHAESSSRRIVALFVYAEGVDGFSAFQGILPDGIGLLQSRESLLNVLGPAEMSGEHHDKWQRNGYSIIANYKKSGPLKRVAFVSY